MQTYVPVRGSRHVKMEVAVLMMVLVATRVRVPLATLEQTVRVR